MKEMLRLSVVLTLVAAVAGLLLAQTHKLTEEPIRRAKRAERVAALRKVLPAYDNEPDRNKCALQQAGRAWAFAVARKGGVFVGAAFESVSEKGYGGSIRVLVGVLPDGTVQGVEILEHRETPGLGAKIAKDAFRKQFAGRPAAATNWAVDKDGGDIHAITGATISSRAVVDAVKTGLAVYQKHTAEIAATGE